MKIVTNLGLDCLSSDQLRSLLELALAVLDEPEHLQVAALVEAATQQQRTALAKVGHHDPNFKPGWDSVVWGACCLLDAIEYMTPRSVGEVH